MLDLIKVASLPAESKKERSERLNQHCSHRRTFFS